MKFKAQVGGLLAGVKPMVAVATKGVLKDYPQLNLITFKAVTKYLEAIADGGHVSASNEISNETYNLDYNCLDDGVVTVNAIDLEDSLSSFSPSEIAIFEVKDGAAGGKELSISLEKDSSEFQTLPVQDIHCEYHEPDSDKKAKTVSITLRRETFISYANKISFAHGDQQQFKDFTYWMLKSTGTNELRFAAGSGTRFAVVELFGNNLSNSKGNINLLFPNEQTQPILNVLNELSCQDIVIESKDRCISITCNKTRISLYTCDPNVVWPDENKFLRRESKFVFTTKIGNWKNAVKGILATNNDDIRKQNKIHSCSFHVDLAKCLIQARTDTTLKSFRKILIDDMSTNEDKRDFTINCVSTYINEIVSSGSDDEYLQFEVDDPSKPVVVRYYSSKNTGDSLKFTKPTDDGINERYSIFFATLKG